MDDEAVRIESRSDRGEIKFKADKRNCFYVAEYEGPVGESGSSASAGQKGIPLCPRKVDASIDNSKLHLRSLELKLEKQQGERSGYSTHSKALTKRSK